MVLKIWRSAMRKRLATRIGLIFGLWAAALTLIYSVLVVVLAFSTEDRLMEDLLAEEAASFRRFQEHEAQNWIPSSSRVSLGEDIEDLSDRLPDGFDPTLSGIQEFDGSDGRHYHAMSLEPDDAERSKILILDTSEMRSVTSHLDGYVRFLSLVGLVVLSLTAVISFVVGRRAAKPIRELSELVSSKPLNALPVHFAQNFGEDEVGTLAGALEGSLTQAREALERERTFNHGVSHELRSSLQVAEHAVELIQAGPAEPVDTKVLARLSRAIESMRGASEAFLWLARPDRIDAALESLVINDIVHTARAHMQSAAEVRGVEIVVVGEGGSVIEAPDAVLMVVISNLLRNAIQHSGTGIITITMEGEALQISDEGRGMSIDQIDALNRGDPPDQVRGVGLGLVLCRRLCERFGWTLVFESPGPDLGMTVRLDFNPN
jgi:signal transduction histidine kinase